MAQGTVKAVRTTEGGERRKRGAKSPFKGVLEHMAKVREAKIDLGIITEDETMVDIVLDEEAGQAFSVSLKLMPKKLK